MKTPAQSNEVYVCPKVGRVLAFSVISLLCLAAYFNTLHDGFVSDDIHQIVNNAWIKDIRHMPLFFHTDVWAMDGTISGYYRPLMYVFFTLEYSLFGLNPFGYHLVNILFHIGVSALVFIVLKRALQKYRPDHDVSLPALVGAALFAVHPVHTEAVTWISDITDLSSTFFCLASFWVYITAEAGNRKINYVYSAILFFVATLCKESALVLPAVFLAYDALVVRRGFASGVPGYAGRFVPYLAAAAVYLPLRFSAHGVMIFEHTYVDHDPYYFALNVLHLFVEYINKILFPVNLKIVFTFHPVFSIFDKTEIVSLALMGTVVAFAVWSYRNYRLMFFGFVFFVITLIPVLNIYALGENVFAVRYLYMPSVGFAIIVATAADTALIRRPVGLLAYSAALVLMVVLYVSLTVDRNHAWRDELTYWTDAVERSPDGRRAQLGLGLILYQRGRVDEAIAHYKTALALDPKDIMAHGNLGLAYTTKGMLDQAIQEYKTALSLDKDYIISHYNLGIAYSLKGLMVESAFEYKAALALRPDYLDTHKRLGIVYLAMGSLDDAVDEFKMALKQQPEDSDTLNDLGISYLRKGMFDDALECIETAERIDPASAQIHANLVLVHEKIRKKHLQ